MKQIVLFLVAFPIMVLASDSGNTNSNNVLIIKPEINVKECCVTTCKPKTRVIVKKEVVEKQVIVKKPVEKIVYVDKIVVKKEIYVPRRKKNRISLLAGVGPTNLTQVSPTQVNLVTGLVGGLQYQRSLTDDFNLGVQVQTNKTVLGSVGFDF